MSLTGIGEVIKKKRKELGITQKKLCHGLCSPSFLCKIESGKTIPERKLWEYLIGRLGLPESFFVPVTLVDFKRAQLEREINSCLAINDYHSFLDKLREYRDCDMEMTNLELQYYYSAYGAYALRKNARHAYYIYKKALDITMSDLNLEESFADYQLSNFELMLISDFAISAFSIGIQEKALKIFKKVQYYFENDQFDLKIVAGCYPVFISNYAAVLSSAGNYDEALRIIKKGVLWCTKYKKLSPIPYLLYIKAVDEVRLNKQDEFLKDLKDSLHMFDIVEQQAQSDNLKNKLKNAFGEAFLESL